MRTAVASLARESLRHEWRRYLAAVLALAFSALLVMVQVALLLGLFGSVSAVIDLSGADLWLGYPNTPSVDLGRPVGRFCDVRAWAHPDVQRVERIFFAYGDLRRADGAPISVAINAVDVSSGALALSRVLTPESRDRLREPSAIIVDAADLDKLGGDVGTEVEINRRRARIVGVVEGMRAIGGVNVIASFATAQALAPDTPPGATHFALVGLKPGADRETVAREVADKAPRPRYDVWEAERFSVQSQFFWLFESGAGIGSGFGSLIALAVGMFITSQTLSGAVLASIKEYAALRALGVSRRALRAVVVEQSLWIGLVGAALAGALTAGVAWLGDVLRIAMRFPVWMLAAAVGLTLGAAVLSGLLSLRALNRADPASLLR